MILNKPHVLFLIFSLFTGFIYLVITPPFQVPDEEAHFYRSYHVAGGNILGRMIDGKAGDFLPASLRKTAGHVMMDVPFDPQKKVNCNRIMESLNAPLNSGEVIFTDFRNTVLYSPVPYLPQSAGIAIGRIFFASPLMLMYLGRLINLLCWALLTSIAIAVIPKGKWVLFLLGLMPMSVFLAASLSADALTNAISFVLIALFFRLHYKKDNIQNGEIAAVIFSAICLVLCKQAYFLLPFLFIFLPHRLFAGRKQYGIFLAILLLADIVPVLIWNGVVKDIFAPMNTSISPTEQIWHILNNPGSFFIAMLKTISSYKSYWCITFFAVLGWAAPYFPKLTYAFAILIVLTSAINYEGVRRLSPAYKAIMIGFFISSSLLLAAMMYVSWNPVGNNIIHGVQGRYFIPIIPLIFLNLDFISTVGDISPLKAKLILLSRAFVILFPIASAAITTIGMLDRYY